MHAVSKSKHLPVTYVLTYLSPGQPQPRRALLPLAEHNAKKYEQKEASALPRRCNRGLGPVVLVQNS
jgi:hypothetical protein